ncbi:DNA/RNA-binding domain, Est1-type [Trema orientale]|uniref:DNA/RNA-binding domain, Est1-type n=1 Tax=Trema orientale TaxID=63057 RepID=A0A2P5FIJ5_TREOI|nr:DNA/RNA-binding domain, Est1-type [Trema orientale]
MIIQADKMSAPSSRERAQQLYDKIIELESRRRRSAQARVPSDPSAWQQIRENYEAIILEDHTFSEQHSIEYALWQLHYKRIEELRAHFNAALSSSGSNSSQNVKGPARPDRLTKIRLQFKTFLSEASGFYHDLIVKIRGRYGLPLGYFSEDSENQSLMEKDGKKSAEVKKGLISCHRCLIYLGDLARYKGLYGEGDSKTREFAAASSYYLQAASLWPSSGNPHHQLAILASYSGDELVAVYRYFRSLAVDSPFSTARENLIVAFEKNRHSYTQLTGDANARGGKESPAKFTGKARGKAEGKPVSKDANTEASLVKEGVSSSQERYKSFCVRFVRLNGILFTRTSLETFAEVLSLVSGGLRKLLSSGPEEELTFGADAVESGLVVVRLVAILIFTVHNVNRESEGQTYAEILQRNLLLKNACTAVYELMSHILERCVQLRDPSSSFLLPGILVFVEWLACCPDVAAGSDLDEKQCAVRSKFWNLLISFLNKLLSVATMSIDDDEDETCFNNMSRYEEGNTENRLALWEDFELRGYVPLIPAQTLLDFSRKHSFGSDGQKEKKARIKRALAAGKALASVVRVDQKAISFDSRVKKFVIGADTEIFDDMVGTYSGIPSKNDTVQENQAAESRTSMGIAQTNQQLLIEGDEEDEVIVFKPLVSEKRSEVVDSNLATYEGLKPSQNASPGDLTFSGSSMSAPPDNVYHQRAFDGRPLAPVSVGNVVPQHLQPVQPYASKWLMGEEASLANSLNGLRFTGNGHLVKSDVQENNPALLSVPIQQSVNFANSGAFYNHTKAPESFIPSMLDVIASSGAITNSLTVKTSSALPIGLRKNPVSRPSRHLGPPPGFSRALPKQVNEPISGSDLANENPMMDDYSWLDGYQVPSSAKSSGLNNSINYPSHSNAHPVTISNGLSGTVNFPFPGKQVPTMQFQSEKQKGWQDYSMFDNLKLQHEQQLQQQQQQQVINGNQHFNPLPEQYQGQSGWTGVLRIVLVITASFATKFNSNREALSVLNFDGALVALASCRNLLVHR